jgi:hypothetical protein
LKAAALETVYNFNLTESLLMVVVLLLIGC